MSRMPSRTLTEQECFLQAILDEPWEQYHRDVFSDWLLDNDMGTRVEIEALRACIKMRTDTIGLNTRLIIYIDNYGHVFVNEKASFDVTGLSLKCSKCNFEYYGNYYPDYHDFRDTLYWNSGYKESKNWLCWMCYSSTPLVGNTNG